MSNKIAIVDIDGTLVPESARLRAQAEVAMPAFNTADTEEFVYRFFEVNDYVAKHEPEKKNDIAYYLSKLAERYGVALSGDQLQVLVTDWERAYSESNTDVVAFPGASDFLATLRARGYRIIAASGGSRESRIELLKQTGLMNHIDGLLAAKETGFQKQQAGFWDALQVRFPEIRTAEHVVMIGNQFNDDVLHPAHLGYKVFMVKWPSELDKIRFGADSVVSKEIIAAAAENIAMTAESLEVLLEHKDLQ